MHRLAAIVRFETIEVDDACGLIETRDADEFRGLPAQARRFGSELNVQCIDGTCGGESGAARYPACHDVSSIHIDLRARVPRGGSQCHIRRNAAREARSDESFEIRELPDGEAQIAAAHCKVRTGREVTVDREALPLRAMNYNVVRVAADALEGCIETQWRASERAARKHR